ncbi:MAG: MFS transporter [Clostridia bacterium]|nr:MFS transporter [Clostridia bacterium]
MRGESVYKENLRRVIVETVLTSIGASFSVATITIFWNSIGMNQATIGFVQMAFTIVLCLLDMPMGYLADRFNRKALNVVGDIGVAITFVYYAFAKNVYMTLIAECVLGIFMAMTNGVDQSFIKYNCDKIDPSGELFKKINPKVFTTRYIAMLVVTILGGFIAKYSLRLAIGIAFIPYFIGGLIGFKIHDYGEKQESKNKNLIIDMVASFKEIMNKRDTRVLLGSYILGKEITHAQIWVMTPMLIMVGVPIEIVSIGWVFSFIMQIIGSKLSEKMVSLKTSNKFAIPISIEILWMLVLIASTNKVTIWLFALNGFVHGLVEGNMATSVQESARNEIQTSVMSVASTGARLLYIPLVYFINYLGNIKLQLALVGVTGVFLPLSIVAFVALRGMERR